MTRNTSIVLIAVIAAVMVAGALAVTVTTGDAYAKGISQRNMQDQSSSVATGSASHSSDGTDNGVNGGNNGHNPCDNAGPAEHNPHCQ
jgi:hypothetical protein